jgi:hypothetical protein
VKGRKNARSSLSLCFVFMTTPQKNALKKSENGKKKKKKRREEKVAQNERTNIINSSCFKLFFDSLIFFSENSKHSSCKSQMIGRTHYTLLP